MTEHEERQKTYKYSEMRIRDDTSILYNTIQETLALQDYSQRSIAVSFTAQSIILDTSTGYPSRLRALAPLSRIIAVQPTLCNTLMIHHCWCF
jgi:hypothetical protein